MNASYEIKPQQLQSVGRRRFLRSVGAGAALVAGGHMLARHVEAAGERHGQQGGTAPTNGSFTLPPLPYAYNALEPYVDSLTMHIHHTRHHAAYVNNLNTALKDYPELKTRDATDLIANLEALPENIRTAVRNNGGGHVNHAIFWAIMSPGGGGEPTGQLRKAIDATFGDVASFKGMLNDAAGKRFGSGWAWLVVDGSGRLQITSTANQDSPYMAGQMPLLGVDVWEHAYYLKYQNRRADYLNSWWNVVNWHEVARRFEGARG